MRMTRMVMVSATALVAAGCGPSVDPALAQGPTDREDATAGTAADASSMASRGECPSPGPLAEAFDVSGTPLVFDFRHPAGFVVRSAQDMGDGIYKIELAREVAVAGQLPRTSVISVLQLPSPGDSPIPPGIPTSEQIAGNATFQAMADLLPKPAETIDFDGRTIKTFRTVTDTKVVYKFNLPDGDHYQTVDVHFYPPPGPANCVPVMESLATQWIRQLMPRKPVPNLEYAP